MPLKDFEPPRRLTIQELMDESWQCAEDKGWHTLNKSFGEECALFHSEISETLEEYRNGHAPHEIYEVDGKPEGCPIELADALIRIADTCKARGIDLERALRIKAEYNRTRPHLHGGKKL